VTVNIAHSFIGDLRVTLIAPSGASVVLHNRNGGSTQNLQRTFDLASVPGLATLAGQPVEGTWSLLVQDLAARDIGRLNMWELEIQAGAASTITLEESPGLVVPDNTPAGVERTLSTSDAGAVTDLTVSVDMTHTFIGDLQLTLISPAGTSVVLHNRAGGAADNIIQSYTPALVPALGSLRGQPVAGSWRLRIADLEALDVGKLNKWALKISR
jgi:subtilisin-like proprotein convertase family protein